LEFTKGEKLIMAAESNSRSTSWNNKIRNYREKKLGEFIASNNL